MSASPPRATKVVMQPVPSIKDRLKQLQPSHELLGFYRQKIAEFDGEHADMLAKLERYKVTFADQHKLDWTVAQREEEINQLQKALSDMQVYLFQEREHVLRLYAENDRLKILELEDRKKIQHLLGLTQPVEKETTYFRDERSAKLVVARGKAAKLAKQLDGAAAAEAVGPSAADRRKASAAAARRSGGKGKGGAGGMGLAEQDRVETLLLTVEALQAQMEDNTRLANEKELALTEDRRVREEEVRAVQARDAENQQELTDKLHQTQDLLYDSTRDYLELKYEHRDHERAWIEEKETLLQRIEELKDDVDSAQTEATQAINQAQEAKLEDLDFGREFRDAGTNVYRPGGRRSSGGGGPAAPPSSSAGGHSSSSERAAAQAARDAERESMAEMYREQCIQLEDELCRLREEKTASKDLNAKRSKKILRRLDLMKQRYEALEKRRLLEAEGYKSSIKILRKRLSEVEQHIYRLASQWAGGGQDTQMLRDVHATATRSKKVLGELQILKSRVHEAERAVRNGHMPTAPSE